MEQAEVAERAAACWNALAGIEDPEAWVREAKEVLAELIERYRNCMVINGTDPEYADIGVAKYSAVLKAAGQ